MVQSIATAPEGSPCTFPGNLHPSRLDFIPLQICFACSRTSRKWSQIALSPKDPFTPHNAYEIHPCYYGCHICLSSLLSMGLRNFQKLWYISWTTQETPYSSGQKKKPNTDSTPDSWETSRGRADRWHALINESTCWFDLSSKHHNPPGKPQQRLLLAIGRPGHCSQHIVFCYERLTQKSNWTQCQQTSLKRPQNKGTSFRMEGAGLTRWLFPPSCVHGP